MVNGFLEVRNGLVNRYGLIINLQIPELQKSVEGIE
jgi:hypothetical protein